ncbi:MAG: chitobiase/beta-hexosaminidase C-terminal domain-containing protein, partial [Paramuribaculum sp.]|nr:chitobiase/beta-hexosaminidase C-terminal domain-containing protein [Paramuribaculum sp.]
NIISDEIKIWVDEATATPGATYTYHTYINNSDENFINTPVGIGRENAVTLAMDKLFGAANEIKMEISGSLSYQACHGSNYVDVFGDTTTLTLRRHKADVEGSIAAFKTKYLESTDLPTLGSDNFAATHYSKLDDTEGAEAKALVIETTPNWLYVRDLTAGADATSNNFLMLNNTNGWESPRIPDATAEGGERALRPGDIITGFAMIPASTSLGNLVSANTGFARTVKYLETSSEKTDSTIIRINYENPADAEHYFKNIAFDEDNRMMMFTLKNVKVDVKNISGNDEYILRIGDTDASDHKPVSLNLSIFEHRVGGWRLAYKEDAEYDITGVLVKNDEIGGYSLALINFYGTGLTETPEVFVADSEDKSAEVQNFTHTLTFEMTAGTNAEIWFTTDGTDPRNNIDSRQHYTGPVKLDLAEGQDRVVVKAFAVEAGMTPSATVTRTFVKNSRELSLLLNFINRAEEGTDYHFNGTVRVVDIVGNYMFVRGVAGHYMPIYLEGGWESNALSAGDYLTDFLINPLFAGKDENKVLRAAEVTPGFESKFDTPLTGSNLPDIDISNTPEVTEVGANNIRRKVSLTNVMFAHPEGNDAAWLMLAHSGEATPVAVNAEATGIDMSEVRANTNYAVTGYVMVAENSDAIEFWPMNLTVIPTPAPVKAEVNALAVKENGNEYTASFYPTASVAFTHEDPRATIQYFIGDNETDENTRWYEYYAGHPLVITESCHIHVRALNAQGKTSAETHVNLTLLTPAGDVVFAQVDDDKEGTSTVTLAAKDGSDAEIWYSVDTPDNMEKYDNPFTLDKTAIVYARIRGGENAADGALCHSLVIVPAKPEAPKDIETNGNSLRFSQTITEEGWAVVTIEPVTPVEGGTIYYTTEAGKKLPGEGIKYEAPVVMKESGVIIAIMTIEGHPASQAYETTVWVVPVTTGIDGIEGSSENAVRVDGDSIVAPEGSEVFDINGRRVNPTGLAGGVYIVRTPEGKAVKVRI